MVTQPLSSEQCMAEQIKLAWRRGTLLSAACFRDEAAGQVLLAAAPLRFPVPGAPPGTACLPPRGPVLERCELRWPIEGSGGLQVR